MEESRLVTSEMHQADVSDIDKKLKSLEEELNAMRAKSSALLRGDDNTGESLRDALPPLQAINEQAVSHNSRPATPSQRPPSVASTSRYPKPPTTVTKGNDHEYAPGRLADSEESSGETSKIPTRFQARGKSPAVSHTCQSSLAVLGSQSERFKDVIVAQDRRIAELTSHIEMLKTHSLNDRQACEAMAREAEALKAKLAEAESVASQHNSAMSEDVENLRAQLSTAESSLNASHSNFIQLQTDYSKLESVIEGLRTQITCAEAARSDSENKLNAVSVQLKMANDELQTVRFGLESEANTRVALEKALMAQKPIVEAAGQSERMRIEAEQGLVKLHTQLADLQRQIKTDAELRRTHATETDLLRKDLAAACAALDAYKTENSALKSAKEKLDQQLTLARAQIERSRIEGLNLQADLSTVHAENLTLKRSQHDILGSYMGVSPGRVPEAISLPREDAASRIIMHGETNRLASALSSASALPLSSALPSAFPTSTLPVASGSVNFGWTPSSSAFGSKLIEYPKISMKGELANQNSSVSALQSSITPVPWATHENVMPLGVPAAITPNQTILTNHSARGMQANPQFDSTRVADRLAMRLPSQDSDCESELLKLNVERQDILNFLARMPVNTSGKTVAERREKQRREMRLHEVEKSISDIKALLRRKRVIS